MRNSIYYMKVLSLVGLTLFFVQCSDDEFGKPIFQDKCSDGVQNGDETGVDCGGSECPPCTEASDFDGLYRLEDQMGRPAVNLFFNKRGYRDSLNITLPHIMKDKFQDIFADKIKLMDSTYTTNVLGLDAEAMAAMFSEDVLWVSESGPTTFYNGTQIMTGRALGEDVMDAMLLWIFGGPDGTKNSIDPLLIQDGVYENDASFLNEFPYLAPPF